MKYQMMFSRIGVLSAVFAHTFKVDSLLFAYSRINCISTGRTSVGLNTPSRSHLGESGNAFDRF
jgi:hypothetical protein